MPKNNFQNSAERGNIELLQHTNNLGWNTTLATDEFSVYDALITTPNRQYLAETKHREKVYNEMIMEDKKMHSIIRESKKIKEETGEEYGVLYINTFNDGTALVWNINKELMSSCESKIMQCPLTTSGYQKRVDKLVWLLPTEAAYKVEKS